MQNGYQQMNTYVHEDIMLLHATDERIHYTLPWKTSSTACSAGRSRNGYGKREAKHIRCQTRVSWLLLNSARGKMFRNGSTFSHIAPVRNWMKYAEQHSVLHFCSCSAECACRAIITLPKFCERIHCPGDFQGIKRAAIRSRSKRCPSPHHGFTAAA